ncbi:MAG: hypothetical protein AAGG48_25735 [Planctomycetota bacterium]
MWISDAIDRNVIQPSRAAHHSGGPQAAIEWLRSNYYAIPDPLRPPKKDIDEFAAFFSTYLTSSFDVIEKPGTKGEGSVLPFGCRCELCMRIVNAPHLQAKKLYTPDKKRADYLMMEQVIALADESGLEIGDSTAMHIVKDPATRRHAAYIAYGHWLVLRLKGETDGPAVLALWRLIAWDPRGGMRPGFQLKIDDFQVAEKEVRSAIKSTAAGHDREP